MRTVLLAIVLFLASAPAAQACRCVAPGDPARELAAADAALYGEVVRVNAYSIYGVSYRFRVERDYKANLGRKVRVLTAGESAACGLRLDEGDRVGLLLTRDNGTWNGFTCGVRTRRHLRRGAAGRAARISPAALARCPRR